MLLICFSCWFWNTVSTIALGKFTSLYIWLNNSTCRQSNIVHFAFYRHFTLILKLRTTIKLPLLHKFCTLTKFISPYIWLNDSICIQSSIIIRLLIGFSSCFRKSSQQQCSCYCTKPQHHLKVHFSLHLIQQFYRIGFSFWLWNAVLATKLLQQLLNEVCPLIESPFSIWF